MLDQIKCQNVFLCNFSSIGDVRLKEKAQIDPHEAKQLDICGRHSACDDTVCYGNSGWEQNWEKERK